MLIAKLTAIVVQTTLLAKPLTLPTPWNKADEKPVLLVEAQIAFGKIHKPNWRVKAEALQAKAGIGDPNEYPKYLDCIERISAETGFPAEIICALIHRETHWRNFVGDNGNGFGLTQVDKRSHQKWLSTNNWRDPYANIRYSLSEIQGYYNDTGSIEQALASYNAGPTRVSRAVRNGKSPDSPTTGGNYSRTILNTAGKLGWNESKKPLREKSPGKKERQVAKT